MRKFLQTVLMYSLLIILLTNASRLKAQCTGFSFSIDDITITSVTPSGIFYDYTIRNTGTTDVSTNNLLINNSLSTDKLVGGDDAAGGSFISGSTIIPPNGTFFGSFQTSSNKLPTHPYLIMDLAYGVIGTCSASLVKEFKCLRPDAELITLTIDEAQPTSVSYQIKIKNAGGENLILNDLLLENYLSVDNTYDASDISAGSGAVSVPSKTHLTANEVTTVVAASTGAISGYNYLITKVTYSETECLTNNNELVAVIPAINGLFSTAADETNSISWNSETKCFTIHSLENTSGNLWQYKLYNSAGVLQNTGSTNKGQSTLLHAEQGLYVLLVTDGKKRYSKRIIY